MSSFLDVPDELFPALEAVVDAWHEQALALPATGPAGDVHETFARAVRVYCTAARASVTSWGRTEVHNRAVGGAPTSNHLRWLAADVVYDQTPDLAHVTAAAAAVGLQVHRERDHDHLSPAGGPV